MSWTRRAAVQAAALMLVGAAGGAVLAATVGASASSGSGSGPSYAAGPSGEGGPSGAGGPSGTGGPGPGAPRFGMHHPLPLSGTVAAVGSASVSITVNGATKTYAVDSRSDIDKSGEAKLSDLRVGDAVRFALRPDGKTIAVLHAGDESKNMPAGGRGPGGPGFGDGMHHGLPLTGTVTSLGSNSVTIKVNGADKTYAVTSTSDIDKNGEAKLSDLKAGDAVRFALMPDGKTIAVLHAGDEAKDRPAAGSHGDGHWGPPPGAPGYGGTAPSSPPPSPS